MAEEDTQHLEESEDHLPVGEAKQEPLVHVLPEQQGTLLSKRGRECRIRGNASWAVTNCWTTPRCVPHDHHEPRLRILRAGRPARAATLAAQSARGRSGAPGRDRGRPAQNEGGIFRREMPVSAPAGLGMKLQAKGADDFQDGGEITIALAGMAASSHSSRCETGFPYSLLEVELASCAKDGGVLRGQALGRGDSPGMLTVVRLLPQLPRSLRHPTYETDARASI